MTFTTPMNSNYQLAYAAFLAGRADIDIAKELGLSRERVRQLRARAAQNGLPKRYAKSRFNTNRNKSRLAQTDSRVAMWKPGMTRREFAKVAGVSFISAGYIARARGLTFARPSTDRVWRLISHLCLNGNFDAVEISQMTGVPRRKISAACHKRKIKLPDGRSRRNRH